MSEHFSLERFIYIFQRHRLSKTFYNGDKYIFAEKEYNCPQYLGSLYILVKYL